MFCIIQEIRVCNNKRFFDVNLNYSNSVQQIPSRLHNPQVVLTTGVHYNYNRTCSHFLHWAEWCVDPTAPPLHVGFPSSRSTPEPHCLSACTTRSRLRLSATTLAWMSHAEHDSALFPFSVKRENTLIDKLRSVKYKVVMCLALQKLRQYCLSMSLKRKIIILSIYINFMDFNADIFFEYLVR